MAFNTSEAPGLPWQFGSLVSAGAFFKLAVALRLIFWGLTLQLGIGTLAGCIILVGRGMPQMLGVLLPVGFLGVAVGIYLVSWGEHRCLKLRLPPGTTRTLPGHGWLRVAYWTLLSSFILQLVPNLVNPAAVRVGSSFLHTASLVCLLLFLRRVAVVIDRHDLRRFIDVIFAMGAIVFAVCAILAALALNVRLTPRMVLPILGIVAACTTIASTCYVILLWRMGTAVREFGQFLASENAQDMGQRAAAVIREQPDHQCRATS